MQLITTNLILCLVFVGHYIIFGIIIAIQTVYNKPKGDTDVSQNNVAKPYCPDWM